MDENYTVVDGYKRLVEEVKNKNEETFKNLDPLPAHMVEKYNSLVQTKSQLENETIPHHHQILHLLKMLQTEQTGDLSSEEAMAEEGIEAEARMLYTRTLSQHEQTRQALIEDKKCLQTAIDELSQKISMLDSKYKSIDSNLGKGEVSNKLTQTSRADVGEWKQVKGRVALMLKSAQEERVLMEERAKRLERQLKLVDQSTLCSDSQADSQERTSMLEKRLSTLETLVGVWCSIVDENTVEISFKDPNKGDNVANKVDDVTEEGKRRFVATLGFQEDGEDRLELISVKTNFEVGESQINPSNFRDLPKLVKSLKKLWVFSNEISSLRDKYPVDWKAEERQFRLIIGQQVCDLQVPLDYPASPIRLDQIIGESRNLTQDDIALPEDNTLTGWVDHLHTILS